MLDQAVRGGRLRRRPGRHTVTVHMNEGGVEIH